MNLPERPQAESAPIDEEASAFAELDEAAAETATELGRQDAPPSVRGVVVIVGRPNVGKSTLFNRLTEAREAIVDDTPGVTRDRLEGICFWNGLHFRVIDTGGFLENDDDPFAAPIREQIEISLREADVILFTVDAKAGLLPQDHAMAKLLRRRAGGKVITVVNKADNATGDAAAGEFYTLGLPELFPVAATSGRGTGELLDHVAALLRDRPMTDYEPGIPRLAILGRPNVGKSSFINALLGRSERVVTERAGTTRDARDVRYRGFGHDLYLVDTAGLRKKANVVENIEYYSTLRTVRAIQHCDIAMVMLDAALGIEQQDLKIISLVDKHWKGLILLVNKWDQMGRHPKQAERFRREIEHRLAPRKNVPILFVSATEKLRLTKALNTAMDVYNAREQRIPTSQLNRDLLPIIEQTPPPAVRGQRVSIKYAVQVPARAPTFLFYTNRPHDIRPAYERFLVNQLRARYAFTGWPIRVFFRQK